MEKWLVFLLAFPTICSLIAFFVFNESNTIRNIINTIATLVNFVVVIYLYPYIVLSPIEYSIPHVMGTGLHLKLDLFRYVFILITSFVWLMINIYSSQYLINYNHRNRYYLFFMITYVSTLGIFISENLLNLFTFFEIMSFASYPLIIHDEDEAAHEAGATYIAMAVTGGLVLLMGIFMLYAYTSSLDIAYISEHLVNLGPVKYVISALMIIGFGVKAGMAPLHIWLPKAHPAAPTPASAVLSAILVKTGIYGIIVTSVFIMKGNDYISLLLIISGFVNMLLGGYLAMHQTDIKKTLAYSTMSQLGYILLGIGLIGFGEQYNPLAVIGTIYHIFNHAIFKSMLFMGVGIIYMITHKLNINDIRGFGSFKPILKITFFIGFCAIIGLPGFNGFTGKTILHHALTETASSYGLFVKYLSELLFYLSGAMTTAYLLKLYLPIFVENNSKYYASYRKYINKRALFPMVFTSIIILVVGIKPHLFVEYFKNVSIIFNLETGVFDHLHYYSANSVFSSFVTIGIGIFIYVQYILKKLTKSEAKQLTFVNITGNWFSVEKNIYLPLFNYTYLHVHKLFKSIDDIVSFTIRILSTTYRQLASVELMTINPPMRLMKLRITMKKPDLKANIEPLKKAASDMKPDIKQVSKNLDYFSLKLNSITYSIYLLGAFIVLVLLIVIIFNS